MTAIATAPPDLKHYRSATTLLMREAQDTELPAGVCGQVEGIALVYDVIDSMGTTFARGCIDRTARERVAAGKVRLFLDHGDMPSQGMYDTHLHIGTVRELVDEQGEDGKWRARFRADLFNTAPGREAHEYLKAVSATQSETGVSIGMLKEPKTVRTTLGGVTAYRIDEIALGEISVTSMPSVPGTRVTAVRADQIILAESEVDYSAILAGIHATLGPDRFRALTQGLLGNAPHADRDAATATDAANGDSQLVPTEGAEPATATDEERLAFVRANLHRLY